MPLSLQERIRNFYDASSSLWEQIWGEHMHHGYYGADGKEKKERRQAQIDLIEALLDWGEVNRRSLNSIGSTPVGLTPTGLTPTGSTLTGAIGTILDVGCGIGGSSLYLAEKFGANVTGITLSPVQAQRASERAQAAGYQAQTHFLVADALQMPFESHTFDLVWSMESGEHMPDKAAFLQECQRVLKPGGKLLMATWCHRPIESQPLTAAEQNLLAKIYEVYCLPYVISLPEYEAIAQQLGFEAIETADWSVAVAPFWDVVIDSALTPQALWGLARSGWGTIRGALSLGLMQRGYEQGVVRFGLLRASKK